MSGYLSDAADAWVCIVHRQEEMRSEDIISARCQLKSDVAKAHNQKEGAETVGRFSVSAK